MRRVIKLAAFLGVSILWAGGLPAAGQTPASDSNDQGTVADGKRAKRVSYGFEVKAHLRDSDEARFPSPLGFPQSALPPGETQAFLETPDAGEHGQLSAVTLWGEAQWSERWSGRLKIDLIDRYDRNPTSEDREADIDEAWLRFGRETEPGEIPDQPGWFVKLGKFAKFERQDQRHLESYGLVGTASNRLEDIGLEIGADLGRNVYLRASLTEGNPLFFRDPNALAGDNGTSIFDGSTLNPVSAIKTGFPIFYDADVDKVSFDNPEIGLGLGVRWANAYGTRSLDLLAFYYDREMAEEASLSNTFYGGDLDLLLGPRNNPVLSLPITDDRKTEWGLTAWAELGPVSLFGQYLDQDIAGLGRTGFEVEVAYFAELPYFGAIAGRQILPWIQPVVRFSTLDNDFIVPQMNPGPSVGWDWDKLDLGLRVAFIDGVDLTFEHADNEFVRKGVKESADETLLTLRIAFSR